MHAFKHAGLGAVTNTIIFDIVLYEWSSARIQKCGSGCCERHRRIQHHVLYKWPSAHIQKIGSECYRVLYKCCIIRIQTCGSGLVSLFGFSEPWLGTGNVQGRKQEVLQTNALSMLACELRHWLLLFLMARLLANIIPTNRTMGNYSWSAYPLV